MGRRVKDRQLDSRDARRALGRRAEPYWRLISEGCHLGYYRGARVGKWVARYRRPGSSGGYEKRTLGEADDVRDADGEAILTFAQAQDAAREWFAERARGGRRAGPYTVGDALDDYLAEFPGKALASTRARVDAIIRPALGAIDTGELTAEQVRAWHRGRAGSPARLRTARGAEEARTRPLDSDEARRRRKSTANRDLTVLKAALNKAWREGRIHSDQAWRTVKPYRGVEKAKLRYLSDDEARRLVNACDPGFRSLVQAALLTGARYGELAAVKAGDVDLSAGTVWMHETKGGKSRPVYLEAEGLALFREAVAGKPGGQLVFLRPDGTRWKSSQQARPLQQACERAKIDPPATFHDLRRSYGARLAVRGVPMAVIAEALGHADERITRRHYAHLAPSYVADTVRQHVAGLGIVEPSNVSPLEGRRKRGVGR